MAVKVKIYSDYVCPFCFLGKDQFQKAAFGKDVEVEWLPFELRPRPSEQLDPINDPEKLAAWQHFIEPRIKEWGVNMKLPEVSPHPYTDLAHEGFQFAKAFNKGKEYNDKVYEAFFQEGKDIGNIEILAEIALKAGLDKAKFKKALEDGEYKEKQQAALKHAYEEAKIRAVPTFIIGDKRIEGAASKEVFAKALAEADKKVKLDSAKAMQCSIDEKGC